MKFCFALCMVAFEREQVEYVIWKQGLAARTGCDEYPGASSRHNFDFYQSRSHRDSGRYRGKNCMGKSGILKKGVPVMYDANDKKAERVILEKAEEMVAKAYPVESAMCRISERTDESILYCLSSSLCREWDIYVPCSAASYQVMNSAVAVNAFCVINEALHLEVDKETIISGIRKTRWQGRMENPFLPWRHFGTAEHNCFREYRNLSKEKTVQELEKGRKITMLFSAVVEKNYEKMIQEICEGVHLSSVVVTEIHNDRIVPAEELKKYTLRNTQMQKLQQFLILTRHLTRR